MKDGLVLFYIKDEVILPVALTEEQNQTFEMLMSIMPGTITVVDKPQGRAINLTDQLNASKQKKSPSVH
ncbi:hypothetical protein [Desulfosporosinus hippei]|uniref:hypothetical protein n=1 Tax=Desulfosporosinus hippei TaxID=569859 RepID=UPI000B81D3D7|nr:hypothetical protein [Desulfosporosinus hippei]